MTDEKAREVVRSELLLLSRRLQPPEKKGLWHFVNTNFGLWLLSSIVLGGMTFLYSSISVANRSTKANQERLERLDAEVDFRFRSVLGAIQTLQASRAEAKQRTNGSFKRTLHVEPTALTTNDTRLVFNKPKDDETFQMEFANYSVKSLFVEGYYLSQNTHERKAINEALNELESAKRIEHVTLLLDKGVVPPGYVGSSTHYEGPLSQEARTSSVLKMLQRMQKENEGKEVFEAHLRKAFDYWQRRRTITESELPIQLHRLHMMTNSTALR